MLKFKVNITIKLFCHKIVIENTSSCESRKKDTEYSNIHFRRNKTKQILLKKNPALKKKNPSAPLRMAPLQGAVESPEKEAELVRKVPAPGWVRLPLEAR